MPARKCHPHTSPDGCEKTSQCAVACARFSAPTSLDESPHPFPATLAFVALSSKFPCAACHSMPLCPVVKLQVHATPPTPEALPAISAVIVPSSVPSVAKSSLLKSLTGEAYDRRTADGSSATAGFSRCHHSRCGIAKARCRNSQRRSSSAGRARVLPAIRKGILRAAKQA